MTTITNIVTFVESKDVAIIDIRQDVNTLDLRAEIISGLRPDNPTLPSMLLWDDRGQKLFDRLTQCPSYYPFHSEAEILSERGCELGESIPDQGVLLELGCGKIRKTKTILSGFRGGQKQVYYFALDVTHQGLKSSLAELRQLFEDCPSIVITGLLGTYDDCVAWLPHLRQRGHTSVTVLWLGNSIGNIGSHDQASAFLGHFGAICKEAHLACQFIVATDTCSDDNKIAKAYDGGLPEYRDFMLNAPEAANRVLGHEAFQIEDWEPDIWMEQHERTLHLYMAAQHDVVVALQSEKENGIRVAMAKGQRVQLATTGKWRADAVTDFCRRAGFLLQRQWTDQAGNCAIFLLVQED
ncbi:histidine-specific methyltransferase [Xylaria sp. FL0933]|nr:histidine-specific methyltransferase [Xylaria sp. FL0933]